MPKLIYNLKLTKKDLEKRFMKKGLNYMIHNNKVYIFLKFKKLSKYVFILCIKNKNPSIINIYWKGECVNIYDKYDSFLIKNRFIYIYITHTHTHVYKIGRK